MKDPTKRLKRQVIEWKKISAKHPCDKRLVSKIYKELNNNQKTQLKNEQMISIETVPKIY